MTEEVARETKNNAKPVEVYDMDGNLLNTYRSGIAAAQAMGFQQGDISQCCRGMKDSFGGYRFKFVDTVYTKAIEAAATAKSLKRGYAIEYVAEPVYNSHSMQNTYLSSGNLAGLGGVGASNSLVGLGGGGGGGAGGLGLGGLGIGLGGQGSSLLDGQFLTRSSRTSRNSRGLSIVDGDNRNYTIVMMVMMYNAL